MLIFLSFLFKISLEREFFPTLLIERYKNEFSINQFDRFYPNFPESIHILRRDCEKNGNESCLKLGIKLLYSIQNVSDPENFQNIIPIFETCALKNNSHCMDFLTQLHFFHSEKFDYNKSFAQNSLSNTVFARLLRSNLANERTKSCSSSFENIAPITKAAFIEFLSGPLHCIKRPVWLDQKLKTSKTIKSRLKILDKYLEDEKYPQSIDPSLHCTLLYEKGRDLFLSFLNNEKSKYFDEKATYQFILENNKFQNPFYFQDMMPTIFEAKHTTKFTRMLLNIIHLFQLVNYSQRIDAAPKLKSLAEDGDPFASAIILYANKMRIDPFIETVLTTNHTYSTVSPLSEFIDALSYELFNDHSISCEDAFSAYTNFLYQSQVFYDSFDALQAVEDRDYDLALLIYERLALMGKRDAIHNIKMILTKLGQNLTRINLLQEKFNITDIDYNNMSLKLQLEKVGFPKNETINEWTLFMCMLNAENMNQVNEYLDIIVKIHPFLKLFKIFSRFIFEIIITVKERVIRILSSRKEFLLSIGTGVIVYIYASIILKCM